MGRNELQERIARWEGLHTEFKGRIGSPNELAKDLVCMANTDGGQLIIGVSEDRSIVGVEDTDATHQLVDNIAYNNCEPPLTVIQEVLAMGEAKVVVVNIPKGSQRPYRTNQGMYYTRTTSGCRHASREELLRLFQAAGSIFYDETPLLRLSISDLDLDAFDLYLQETGQKDLQIPAASAFRPDQRSAIRRHRELRRSNGSKGLERTPSGRDRAG